MRIGEENYVGSLLFSSFIVWFLYPFVQVGVRNDDGTDNDDNDDDDDDDDDGVERKPI